MRTKWPSPGHEPPLALVLYDRGEVEDAVSELERGLPVLRAQLPPTHADLATALALAVNVHSERRAWAPAAEACIALIRLHRARGEPIPLDLLINAGELSLRQGESLAAIPYYDQALTTASSADPPELTLLAYALNGRGKVYLAQGELALARALFERARSLLAAIDPPIATLTAEVLWGAAQTLAADEHEAARALATRALSGFREADPQAPEVAVITTFLAPGPSRSAQLDRHPVCSHPGRELAAQGARSSTRRKKCRTQEARVD
jgi:tetratricopeptide (TPR) repeat protein